MLFTQGPSITARMVVLVLASIILMTVDHRQDHLGAVRSAISVVLYPIQFLINLPHTAGGWLQEAVSSRRALQEENARLRAQHLLLQARLLKFEALEAENLRLRELLESSFKAGDRLLIAELMSVDFDPYRHEVLLNKGRRQDVYVGQPLLDAHGVMGQIVQVTPYTATAMLITDPAHAIPVQVNRNGLRSIVVGVGSLRELSLPHIPNSADIVAGDLLVTSGLGGRFPPGYPVAEVVSVTSDPGQSFAQIVARPLSQLDRSREVLLVWPPARPGSGVTDTVDTGTADSAGAAPAEPSVEAGAETAGDGSADEAVETEE
ncbi:MAG: rod shape-determining protein MreC [Gammaproteobacteria bacterium]